MTEHTVGTREEWLAARRALLEREKELTRLSDELVQERRELPWVRVDKGLPLRDRGWDEDPGRAVRRALGCSSAHQRAPTKASRHAATTSTRTLLAGC